VLVFTRTKHGADKVVRELARRQIEAQAIHGNKSQNARQKALEKFKSGKIKVLVATDIASRGIDIDELEYVINYDLPETPETYVHRIGRTGRAGNSGVAISLCSYQEQSLLADIEKLIRKEIKIKSNSKYPMVDLTEKQTKKNPQRKNDVSKDKKTKSEKTGDKKETKNSTNKKNKTSDKWKKRQYNASKQSAL
jgi:Superfamily II DNA and RNA helicases